MPSQTMPAAGTPLTLENIPALKSEVRALAEERNAVILAHNYQVPEVQDVAALRRATRSASRARPPTPRPT